MFDGQPLAELEIAQLAHRAVVHALEIAAFAGQQLELAGGQAVAEEVALFLVEGCEFHRRPEISHVGGQAMLRGCVNREHVVLVDLAELGHQRGGRGHIANLPARHVIGLAETGDNETALSQLVMPRHAGMAGAVEDHVLVDLVADHQHLGAVEQVGQLAHLGRRPDGAGRVVRDVDDDGARPGRHCPLDRREIRAEAAGRQRYAHDGAASHFDIGRVAVVAGFQHDHLVACVHDGEQCGEDGLRGAGGDGDLAVGVVAMAVEHRHLGGDGIAQRLGTGHRRVLVVASAHGVAHGVAQGGVAGEVREALAEVDRAMLIGQRRHGAEDGRADLRQAALQAMFQRRSHRPKSVASPLMARSSSLRLRRSESSSAKL